MNYMAMAGWKTVDMLDGIMNLAITAVQGTKAIQEAVRLILPY